MSLLTLENIMKSFQNRALLNGVSLRVEKGDRVALVGENGCGKSTLLKLIMGLEELDSGKVIIARNIKVGYLSQGVNELKRDGNATSQTILEIEKVKKLEKDIRELENKMACIEVKSDNIMQNQLLSEYTRLINRFEVMDGYTIESKVKKTMLGLGLKESSLTIPIDRLSGGEKVRAAMAKILLEEPDLLVLDEPTNHLDINAMEWLEDFLKKFHGGVLLVSHDRYFLDTVATRIAELHDGTITEKKCSYSVFIEQKDKLREYTLKEQKRLRQEIKKTNELVQDLRSMGKIKASMSRQKVADKQNVDYMKKLNDIKNREHLYKNNGPKLTFKNIKHVSKDIAWADKLIKNFGNVTIFKDVSFHIRGGEKIGIIGPNGCGKTTLINLLLEKDKEYTGFIRLGEWVKYCYMGQEILFQDENRTMIEEINAVKELDEISLREYLGRFQFYGEDIYKTIDILSGGEKVRLYLAEIMLKEPDCLFMDEPTNHLDVSARESVEKALSEFKGTVISISHDRYFLTHCVTRILDISNGTITSFDGNYEDYRLIKSSSESETLDKIKENKNIVEKKSKIAKTSDPQLEERNIEGKITELELKIRVLESSFTADTTPDKYVEYDNLINQVYDLYQLWESLSG